MYHKRGSIILSFILLVVIVGGLSAGYLLAQQEELQLAFLIIAAVIGFIGVVILIVQLLGSKRKLRQRLKQMEKLIPVESLEMLKGKYLEIYNLYLKLKEKDKANFYARITGLREQLEKKLKAEKRLQQLLEQAEKGTLEEKRKLLEEMEQQYQELPATVQERYAAQLMQLKEEGEKGAE